MVKTKQIMVISLLAISILASCYTIVNVKGESKGFDSKLQVSGYASFGAKIVDAKVGYFDDDDNIDIAVAYSSQLAIYEEYKGEFEKVDEIKLDDDNFIDDNSNISAIGLGKLIDRNTIGADSEINSVSNSSNCTINDPIPANITYLENIDNDLYNLTYKAYGNGNFTMTLKNTYGVPLSSFNLRLRINDSIATPSAYTNVSLMIYNYEASIWEDWVDLKATIVTTLTDIVQASSTLPNSIHDYFNGYLTMQIKLRYNDSSPAYVNIDYVDLTDVTTESVSDIIVGGGDGEICIIQCTDASENDYVSVKKLNYDVYDNTLEDEDAKYRSVTTILTGDMDNDGTDEFVIGNQRARVYPFNHTTDFNINKFWINNGGDGDDDDMGITWVVKPAQGFIPAVHNTINSLSAIDTPTGNFTLFVGTKKDIYTVTYNVVLGPNHGFPSGDPGLFRRITYLNTEINDVKITNLPGGTSYELICGTLKGRIHAYTITGINFGSSSNYNEVYDSDNLIAKGNEVVALTSGDFKKKGENMIALGSTLTLQKVQVLEKVGKDDLYWDSGIYMRESILSMDTLIKYNDVDTLIVVTQSQVYFLSTDFDDKDKDGLSDLSERLFYDTESDVADTDEDALEDGEEIFVYGTDPLISDTDGDLIPDGLEVQMGTDPLDPLSSIIVIIMIPTIIIVALIGVIGAVRRSRKQKKAEYDAVRNTPYLMPQVRRLIIQRMETFANDFKGFTKKQEMSKFKRNLSTEMMSIILDRLYNFLEYLRLKGILFNDRQELLLRDIMVDEMGPVEKEIDAMIKTLLAYETKYRSFNDELKKTLTKFAEWKKPTTKAKGKMVVEELIKCPKCGVLGPKDSAFCLECGEKLKK